jgi:hypothetical protein
MGVWVKGIDDRLSADDEIEVFFVW